MNSREKTSSTTVHGKGACAFPPLWEKFKPVIEKDRKAINSPTLWIDSEFLYNELKKR